MDSVKRVKTAIVGCGMISNIYIINLKKMFYIIDLVALCDARLQSAREKAEQYSVSRVLSLDEVASSEDIELVINLTGPAAHYDVIKKMLLADKHVFTEKTLAVTLEQARELADLAAEKGLYLGVAPDTVLGASIQTARKIIDSGLIGQVMSCVASINRNHTLNSEVFRFIQNGAGGCFAMDVGIYYVAALLALLGPAQSVCGYARQAPWHVKQILTREENPEGWQLEGNNLSAAAVRFASGALGTLHFNGLSVNRQEPTLQIFGDEGVIKLGLPDKFGEKVVLVKPEGEEVVFPFTHGYNGSPTGDSPSLFERSYGHRGIGAAEMAWAMRMVRPCRCGKEFGFHSMELLRGIEVSSASGGLYNMTSSFDFAPLKSGYYSTTFGDAVEVSAERSLID